MCIYFSFSFSISSPCSLVVFVTLTKAKGVLKCIVVVFVVHDFPTPHCLCHVTHENYMEELSTSYCLKELNRWRGNSARNAHSDMLKIIELESWPVEFL